MSGPSLGLNIPNIGPNKTRKISNSVRKKFIARSIRPNTSRPTLCAGKRHQSIIHDSPDVVFQYKAFVDHMIKDIENQTQFTAEYLRRLKEHRLKMDQDFPGRLNNVSFNQIFVSKFIE